LWQSKGGERNAVMAVGKQHLRNAICCSIGMIQSQLMSQAWALPIKNRLTYKVRRFHVKGKQHRGLLGFGECADAGGT